MSNKVFKLNKGQENLLNIEKLHTEQEMNNINAILDMPRKYTANEIKKVLHILVKNLEFLRLEDFDSKTQQVKKLKS